MGQEALDATGPVVPGYVVGERLGSGGFGEVFRARHAVIGRDVAIKILHAKYSSDEGAVARFVAEARAVNQISHPGIVAIFDFGKLDDGRQYCVMELLHGKTLRDVLRERTRLPVSEAVPLLRAVADAVDAAHAAGIAHRDLKPDNVFVLDSGGIKLIDFGLAKLTRDDGSAPVTQTGAIFGTPLYMSPEQCRGKASDVRTDCYSFGALAYHVLTGAPPFSGEALELALHHLNDTPEPPSKREAELGGAVDRVLLALLDKDPAKRPMPLADAVDALVGARPLPRRRSRRWLVVAAAVVLAGGALVTWRMVANERSTSATKAWTFQRLELPKGENINGLAMSGDGKTLAYQHGSDRSVWVHDTTTNARRRVEVEDSKSIQMISLLDDGRFLFSRQQQDGFWIWLEDPSTKKRERIAAGERARISPDQRRIAFVRGGEVYIKDLATQDERLVASVGGAVLATGWSGDGNRLAWTRIVPNNDPRVEVVDTRDGTIRHLQDVLVRPVGTIPVAFVGPSAVAYCDRQRRLVELDLDSGRKDVIKQLPGTVGVCALQPSRDGKRVVMINALLEASAGVLSLADQAKGWRRIARGGVEDFDGDRVVVAAWPVNPPRHRVTYGIAELPDASAYHVDGSDPKPLPRCPGVSRALRRNGELRYIAMVPRDRRLAVSLVRPSDCSALETWSIPDVPNWMFPRCNADTCATVRVANGEAWVWILPRGGEAREVVKFALTGGLPHNPWPDLSVSPDGKQLAITIPEAEDLIWIIDAQTGAVRRLGAGPWPDTTDRRQRAATTTWLADGSALYVAGGDPISRSSATLVTLDGTARSLGVMPLPYYGWWPRTSPDGKWLAANLLDVTLEMHLVER